MDNNNTNATLIGALAIFVTTIIDNRWMQIVTFFRTLAQVTILFLAMVFLFFLIGHFIYNPS